MNDRRWLVVRFFVGVLVVVVGAEIGARVVESVGPPALRWYDVVTQLKVEQMTELERAEVVFAGTSMVWQGLDPEAFTEMDGRIAYNAALAGGVPEVMERWLTDEVAPRLHPKLVVWGLSSLDFSSTYGSANRERYDDALETRQGVLASFERRAAAVSALVRYRGVLRSFEHLFEGDEFEEAAALLSVGGARRDFSIDVSDLRGEIVASRLYDYSLDLADIAAIHRTVRILEERGITVVLLQMPTPERYTALHPAGHEDLLRTYATIDAIADTLELSLIDLSDGYSADDFVDFTHLNEASVRDLTGRLAAALRSTDGVIGDDVRDEPADSAVPLASLVTTANRALEVNDVLYYYLAGTPPGTASELWFGVSHYGHSRDLSVAAAEERSFDVIFLGSSMMLNAADPAIFTDLDGRSSFNAAIAAAGPEVQEAWISGEFFDMAHPDVVIYGVAPRHVRPMESGEGCMADTKRWHDAAVLRDRAFDPILGLNDLVTPELFFGLPPSAEPSITSPLHANYRSAFDQLGGRTRYPRLTPEEMTQRLEVTDVWQSEFVICDQRLERIGNVVKLLVAEGVTVIVVAMPIPDFRADLFPGGRGQVAEVLDRMERETLSVGAAGFIDLSDLVDDQHFRDITHVDLEGSTQFTRKLVEEIHLRGL